MTGNPILWYVLKQREERRSLAEIFSLRIMSAWRSRDPMCLEIRLVVGLQSGLVLDGLLFCRHCPTITNQALAYVNNERMCIIILSGGMKTAVCGVDLGCQYTNDHIHADWNDGIISVVRSELVKLRKNGLRVVVAGNLNGHIGNVSEEQLSSVKAMEIDDQGRHESDSDHNWLFLSLSDNFKVTHRPSLPLPKAPTWDIKENQDWSDFQKHCVEFLANSEGSSQFCR